MTQESQFVICNPTFCLQNFFLKLDLWNQFILPCPCSPPLPHVHNIHDIDCIISSSVLLLEANGEGSDAYPE